MLIALVAPAIRAADLPSGRESRGMAYYHFLAGALSADEGNLERALSEMDEAARLDQTSSDILVELVDIYLRSGDTDKAIAQGRKAVSRAEGEADAHRCLAEALASAALRNDLNRDKLLEAIGEYRRVVELGGDDPETLTVLGKLQLQADEPEEAATTFQRLLGSSSDPGQTHLLLARALLRSGRKSEAAEHYAEVLDRSPRQIEALSNLAILKEEDEKWEDAAKVYEMLAALRPSEPSVRFHQGLCMLRAGKAQDAVAPLRLAAEMAPANVGASRALAMALRQSGHPAEALDRYHDLLQAAPEDFYLLYEVAGLHADREEGDEASALLERAVAVAEKDPSLRLMGIEAALHLAGLNLASKQPARSLQAVDRAEALGGGDQAETALLRCRALLQAGEGAKAVRASAEAQKRFPGDRRFLWIDAEAAAAAGNVQSAESRISEAVGAQPVRAEDYARASALWARQGDTGRSIAVLQEGARALPDDDGLLMEWGAALERAGKLEEAVATLRHAIELNGENHAALNYLGYLFADQGKNLDEAQRLIEKALSLSPDSGAYLDSLGWVLYKRGRAAEAVEALSRAAELLAGDATVREHLGDVLASVGRRSEAEGEYREAIQRGGPRKGIEGKIKHGPEARVEPVEKGEK